MFIKVVSQTVLDQINAAYHDKRLKFIAATFREVDVSISVRAIFFYSCLDSFKNIIYFLYAGIPLYQEQLF